MWTFMKFWFWTGTFVLNYFLPDLWKLKCLKSCSSAFSVGSISFLLSDKFRTPDISTENSAWCNDFLLTTMLNHIYWCPIVIIMFFIPFVLNLGWYFVAFKIIESEKFTFTGYGYLILIDQWSKMFDPTHRNYAMC